LIAEGAAYVDTPPMPAANNSLTGLWSVEDRIVVTVALIPLANRDDEHRKPTDPAMRKPVGFLFEQQVELSLEQEREFLVLRIL
jgi:hypothetical protein